ncbi:MAG: copper-containing nitrite reductase [Nitrospinae bacterium]|nr:copper-containing nitrite reductase [Nitrospinota bacterium]
MLIFGIDFLHAESVVAPVHPAPHPVMAVADGEHSGDHLKSVGPGEAPHLLSADPARFQQVSDIAKNASEVPPPVSHRSPKRVRFHLKAQEVVAPLAEKTPYIFWTFNRTVPGPLLRARVGDTVELTLENHPTSSHDHSIDLHAVTGPGGGAQMIRVKPGKTKTITFKAIHPGVFIYHCATPNVPTHITNGLYGLIVIDPAEGWRAVDREFYVMQGEVYTKGEVGQQGFQAFSPRKMMDERPEYIVLNGRVKALTGARALQAKQGETIRIFFGNGGVSRISSFHIIGEIFDRVYPEAALNHVLTSVQTTLVPAGGAAVVELTLENSGDYILLDHAISRIDRGAYGILHVQGTPVPELLSPR